MLNNILSSPQERILEKALAASSLRHKVISNNIANVNTPGFKKSEVQFEALLQDALAENKLSMTRTHPGHFNRQANAEPDAVINTITNTSLRLDGNNVDIDAEMANLAKNTVYYEALTQQISRYFSNLISAINEGRR